MHMKTCFVLPTRFHCLSVCLCISFFLCIRCYFRAEQQRDGETRVNRFKNCKFPFESWGGMIPSHHSAVHDKEGDMKGCMKHTHTHTIPVVSFEKKKEMAIAF